MKFQTLVAGFALQVTDINLKKPISTDSFAVLNEKIDQHAVAVFRNQYLKNEQLLEFAETFGPLEAPLPFDQYGGVHEKITMLANVACYEDLQCQKYDKEDM